MAAIYTTDWYEELKELLNHNPDVVKNAPPGTYRVLAEVSGDATSPYLAEGQQRLFVVRLVDGKCTEYSEVSEAPPRKEFDFIFDLPATIFRRRRGRCCRSGRRGSQGHNQDHRRHAHSHKARRSGERSVRRLLARGGDGLAAGQASRTLVSGGDCDPPAARGSLAAVRTPPTLSRYKRIPSDRRSPAGTQADRRPGGR